MWHSNFEDGTTVTCNDGLFVGKGVNVTNNFYTSRLNVNITADLDGMNVECADGNSLETIGLSLISMTRGII